MHLVKCLVCEKEVTSRGIKGHLRFKHDIDEPVKDEHYKLLSEIEEQAVQANVLPVTPQQTYAPAPFPIQPQDPLMQLEVDTARSLRIAQMNKMMTELTSSQQSPEQQQNTLTDFNNIIDLYDKIETKIRDRIPAEAPEGVDADDLITLKLMELLPYLISGQSAVPQQKSEGGQLPMGIKETWEPKIRRMIKEGTLSKEQAKEKLKELKINLSDEVFEEYWKDLSK